MASSEILSQTLMSITNTKLAQLDKQKDAYNNRKRLLVEGADAQTDRIKRARELVEGFKELPSMTSSTRSPLLSLENLDRFIQQAQHDPAVTDAFIQEYESQVRNELQVQSNRYAFASLYGQLVNEWISAGKEQESDPGAASTAVGREEARVQRATWEEYVFAAKSTDKDAIKAYLSSVFEAEEDVKDHLSQLKDDLKRFQDNWSFNPHFNVDSLTTTIKGMLRSDVLTDVKRATLQDFVGNEAVLEEIADVLNVRMATIKTWSWETDLVIDQRRQLNRRYRFYPDEDLLQSIFLHYIGMRWAVEFHGRFRGLLDVWKPNLKPLDSRSQRRLDFFLGESDEVADSEVVPGTMEEIKKSHFESEIFLDQLPKSFEESRGTYGSIDDAETLDTRKSHIKVVQHLLHMIEADILLQKRFGKDITVVRSDFKWFGPSIPHSSIAAVLEFFGVGAHWIEFFIKVLEAPLRFKQDPEDAPSRIRRRGTPLSTPLADVFGEALLFCVDFAVNQKADGARLYRLHDDMWLWGNTEACVKGWEVLGECAKVLGLDFNLEKTGSAPILQVEGSLDSSLASGLPEGDVTWGFLKLDRHTGYFVIDQDEVDKHIEELRIQLDACKTVFNWIQAWNTYGARFFNFFGRPANCSARAHVDSMLDTFQRIQQKLFPDTLGGAGAHLKKMISQRFDIPLSDIPDGYIYFPPEFGGLGLKNPFIDLCLIRDAVMDDPEKEIDSFFEQEARDWRNARATFETGAMRARRFSRAYDFSDLEDEPFMSLEEFRSYRERLSKSLGRSFKALEEEPAPKNLTLKGAVKAVLEPYQWNELTSYDQWVLQLFSKDMISRFGGLNVVERGLLPLGLMGMLRQSKFQWVG